LEFVKHGVVGGTLDDIAGDHLRHLNLRHPGAEAQRRQ
jgi:hypothetical protein